MYPKTHFSKKRVFNLLYILLLSKEFLPNLGDSTMGFLAIAFVK